MVEAEASAQQQRSFTMPTTSSTTSTTSIDAIDCSPTVESCLNWPSSFMSDFQEPIWSSMQDVYYDYENEPAMVNYANCSHRNTSAENTLRRKVDQMESEILQANEKVRKITEAMAVVTNEFRCSICFYLMVDPHRLKNCGHTFCGECLSTWLDMKKSACPECRAKITNRAKMVCPEFKMASAIKVLADQTLDEDDRKEWEERQRNWQENANRRKRAEKKPTAPPPSTIRPPTPPRRASLPNIREDNDNFPNTLLNFIQEPSQQQLQDYYIRTRQNTPPLPGQQLFQFSQNPGEHLVGSPQSMWEPPSLASSPQEIQTLDFNTYQNPPLPLPFQIYPMPPWSLNTPPSSTA